MPLSHSVVMRTTIYFFFSSDLTASADNRLERRKCILRRCTLGDRDFITVSRRSASFPRLHWNKVSETLTTVEPTWSPSFPSGHWSAPRNPLSASFLLRKSFKIPFQIRLFCMMRYEVISMSTMVSSWIWQIHRIGMSFVNISIQRTRTQVLH